MGWSGAFCVAVSLFGLGFAASLEDGDCAKRNVGVATKIAASAVVGKIERRCRVLRFTIVRFTLV